MPRKRKSRATRTSANSHQQQAPSSVPSSVVAASTFEGLPDIALSLIVEHLKGTSLINGLQLANRWAFSYFKGDIQKVAIWTYQILKEDPPPLRANPYKQWTVKYATRVGSLLSRYPKLAILEVDERDEYTKAVLAELFRQQTFPTILRLQNYHKPIGFDFDCYSQLPTSLLMTALSGLVALPLNEPVTLSRGLLIVLRSHGWKSFLFTRLFTMVIQSFTT